MRIVKWLQVALTCRLKDSLILLFTTQADGMVAPIYWWGFAFATLARDMNATMLLSIVMMTLYFVIGSRLEERKLIRYHGEVYSRYS